MVVLEQLKMVERYVTYSPLKQVEVKTPLMLMM